MLLNVHGRAVVGIKGGQQVQVLLCDSCGIGCSADVAACANRVYYVSCTSLAIATRSQRLMPSISTQLSVGLGQSASIRPLRQSHETDRNRAALLERWQSIVQQCHDAEAC